MTATPHSTRRLAHIDYKWIALSNTTLGILMAALNSSIILIALPAVFRGIGINPLSPGETGYLLWSLLGYLVITAVLLVTCGRISDMFGRVRLYNAGFAVFTIGSIMLFFIQGQGNGAAMQLIIFRLIQGVGGAFLFANSTAILTDAFPATERGLALGVNTVCGIAGQFIGLILGGLLAAFNWRLVFLVSVPFGIIGTVWAYLMLHETARPRVRQKIDVLGNLLFAGGLTMLLVALSYGIEPYGASDMGWRNPWVIAGIVGGLLLLAIFVVVEQRVENPMFRLSLFRIRMFTMGNLSNLLASMAQGGLQFMLIIWLQGIWLPLHGYKFDDTPLWAGIYMIPLTVGFLIMGPLSGYLSDKVGSRGLATTGMVIMAAAFVSLTLLPANFSYPVFATLILILGLGMGMFSAPNTTAIMNAVPAEYRGVSSGMIATFRNIASTLSITLIFSLVTVGLAKHLPGTLLGGLTTAGIPQAAAAAVSHLPPVAAIFAAFLGYNPLATLLPPDVLQGVSEATRNSVLGTTFFPNLISGPFMDGVRVAFSACAALAGIAAVVSFFRGGRVVHEHDAMGNAEGLAELAGPEIAVLDTDDERGMAVARAGNER
jgi:EmrB/QacA subfamily drug resistance transporter